MTIAIIGFIIIIILLASTDRQISSFQKKIDRTNQFLEEIINHLENADEQDIITDEEVEQIKEIAKK